MGVYLVQRQEELKSENLPSVSSDEYRGQEPHRHSALLCQLAPFNPVRSLLAGVVRLHALVHLLEIPATVHVDF